MVTNEQVETKRVKNSTGGEKASKKVRERSAIVFI
jgi:hypothetical protein